MFWEGELSLYVIIIPLLFSVFLICSIILFKLLRFTGIGIIAIGLYLWETYALPFFLGKEMTKKNFPEIYPIYEKYMLIFLACLVILFTLRSVIRIVNPNFTFRSVFRKQKINIDHIEKITYPFSKKMD